jgi:c-di-GMP-binding flagellar brake protein YcgR
MLQERRRYFRFPLQIPAYFSTPNSRSEFSATSVNISERGMALAIAATVHVREKLQMRMDLPGTNRTARVSGEVCWSDTNGRVGIQFIQVPQAVSELLHSWLFDRLQESVPERVLANSQEHFAMK